MNKKVDDAVIGLLNPIIRVDTDGVIGSDVHTDEVQESLYDDMAVDVAMNKVETAFKRACEAKYKVNEIYTKSYFDEKKAKRVKQDSYESWQKAYNAMKAAEATLKIDLEKARDDYDVAFKNDKDKALENWIVAKDRAIKSLEEFYVAENNALEVYVYAESVYAKAYRDGEKVLKKAVEELQKAEREAYEIADNIIKTWGKFDRVKESIENWKKMYEDI
ncbi:hypothetical protein [Borrelia persica]|uniref:hypothetical protein n=1 Tax=Borrelia persica TaxID=44448 RepID=UPI0004B36FFD|nr:hypothetical protein [Borrelia persica]